MNNQQDRPRTHRLTWPRIRWGLRGLALVCLVGIPAANVAGWLPGLWLWFWLVVALATPCLWPRQFGSWSGFWLVLLAALAPAIFTRWGFLPLETSEPVFVGVIIWSLAGLLMLPGTIILLLWRRWASVSLMLLSFAALSPLLLTLLLSRALELNPAFATRQQLIQMFAVLIPWLALWFGLCLAPIFFCGSLLWLVYGEAARRDMPVQPAPR